MRWFLLSLLLLLTAVVSVAGLRGSLSRRPPIELFPDMARQPRPRPQARSELSVDNLGSRPPAAGTVARGSAFQESPVYTGRLVGSTNFVETNPLEVTHEFLARGRERFQINCLPCHGALADGRGVSSKYGMVVIGNLHDPRIVRMPDGELFYTVSYGRNLMSGYASSIAAEDRWAVLAYVRALQLSRLATIEDVPVEHQGALKRSQ